MSVRLSRWWKGSRRQDCHRPTLACTRGPVLYQQGDYFGQTVNLTARIADYARPGEVLVSDAVADASKEQGIAFGEIGQVELKGVSGTVQLLRAHLV